MRSLFFMLCLIFPILVYADEPIIIDNTDSGFSTNSTWHTSTNRPGYYGDNYVYANPGDPQKTATWNLGVSKGQYEIAIQWSAYTNRATNAEYIISNNGRQLAIAKVNQRIDGNEFNVFNTFNVKDGILTIVLSSATEGYVIADAVRITKLPDLPATSPGEQHEITVAWDYPVDEPLAIGFDIRTNQNDGMLVSVPKDAREWTGMVDIIPGKNVIDVRTKAMNAENSRWSDPAYYTPPTEPTDVSAPINFKATPL